MKKKVNGVISNVLLCIIFLLVSLIFVDKNANNESVYKKIFFEDSFSFVSFKDFYEKHLGSLVPQNGSSALVFNSDDIYQNYENYYDGVKFLVSDHALINSLASGIVVYKGVKDLYNDCVIIQGSDGYYYNYGNVINSDLKLYDSVEKNSIIGQTLGNEFYLVIMKDNKIVKYEDYKI